jgi:hypothetical protein
VTARSVTELLADLRDRCDIEEMPTRHTDDRLCRYLTQSCRGLRNELTAASFTGFLEWSTPTALPVAPPIVGEYFLEVAWPSTAIEIFGFDVNRGSGASSDWDALERITIGERRKYRCQGLPQAFLIRTLPKEATPATDTLEAGAIQVYPSSTLGLDYRIQYMPEFPELAASPGTQLVQGFDGDWLEWILWDAAVKVAYKDDEDDGGGSLYLKATTERDKVKARFITNINRVNRAGPVTPFRSGSRRARRI